jgi:hypothetical protein
MPNCQSDVVLACGSLVFSEAMFFHFVPCERKKEKRKIIKYRSAKD